MKDIRWRLLLIIVALGNLVLGACQTSASQHFESVARDAKAVEGKSALVGQVFSIYTKMPLPNTIVRLAKVFWNEDHSDGTYILEGATSPGYITDEFGVFLFEDLEPADYVVVIGDIVGYHVIIKEPDGKAKVYTLKPGEVLNLGVIDVELPQQ